MCSYSKGDSWLLRGLVDNCDETPLEGSGSDELLESFLFSEGCSDERAFTDDSSLPAWEKEGADRATTPEPRKSNVFVVSSPEDMDTNPCGDCHCHMVATVTDASWTCPHGTWLYEYSGLEEWGVAGLPVPIVLSCACGCGQEPSECFRVIMKDAARFSKHSWGDQIFMEEWVALLQETPEAKAKRLAKEAKRDQEDKVAITNNSVKSKEEKWTKGGEMKFRVPRPCRYASLFLDHTCAKCNTKVPHGQSICTAQIIYVMGEEVRNGRTVETGKLVPKVVKSGGVQCKEKLAGCWNHEAHRTCIYIHPDEPQWADACSGKLCYDRDSQKFHAKGACSTCTSCNPGIANRGAHSGGAHSGGARPNGNQRWGALAGNGNRGSANSSRPPAHPRR